MEIANKAWANKSLQRTLVRASMLGAHFAPLSSAVRRREQMRKMKYVGLFLILLQFSACIFGKPHRTFGDINCEHLDEQTGNLRVVVVDERSQPMPGVLVTVRSVPDNDVLWQEPTGPNGRTEEHETLGTLEISVEIDGFYPHKQQIDIVTTEKCVFIVHTRPDPHFEFKVT